jgi:hypothetical protein
MTRRQAEGSLYERQLHRLAQHAREWQTTTAAVAVGAARLVHRTQPPPDGTTRFVAMTWHERDGEILPRYLSRMDGPAVPASWSDFMQRHEWHGRLSVEQALVGFPEAVAVPVAALEFLKETSLTPSRGLVDAGGLSL